MFKKGDLVKHASNINWRDQDARGVVTNSVVDEHKLECVFVTWINAKKHNSPNTHLGTSLDLVADCINDVQ
jgi:hypothetical protein|tara:strand:- start:413 stop:625 length:213 start_codon:yes stop_codon:yes gene_type:complete